MKVNVSFHCREENDDQIENEKKGQCEENLEKIGIRRTRDHHQHLQGYLNRVSQAKIQTNGSKVKIDHKYDEHQARTLSHTYI